MKIKMTLIAFFATALMFTSCVKNEVSPGIEDVRSAYAELLSAKAQAEVIAANGQANWDNAQATFLEAQAAVELANAAATAATSADEAAAAAQLLVDAQALAARTLADWEEQNALDAIALQEAMDLYAATLAFNENAVAVGYFGKYQSALIALQTVQGNIYTKNATVLALNLDLVNGTTVGYDMLLADLADAEADLAFWETELATAQTLNGAADVMAAMESLQADSVAYDKSILELNIALVQANYDLDDAVEQQDKLDAVADTAAARTALNLAIADTVNTSTTFFENTVMYGQGGYTGVVLNIPTFWTTAVTNFNAAELALETGNDSTVFFDWQADTADIASGTDAIDAAWAILNDEYIVLRDSAAGLASDSTNTQVTLLANQAAIVASDLKVTNWGLEIADLNLLVAAENDTIWDYGGGVPADEGDGNVWTTVPQTALTEGQHIVIRDDYLDEINILNAYITLEGPIRADLVDQEVLDLAARDIAAADYNDGTTGYAKTILARDAAESLADNKLADKPARLIAIAALEAGLDDKWSTWLYETTLFPDLQANYDAALAAKDAARINFETYLEGFYDAWVVAIFTAYTDALADHTAAMAAFDAAVDALELVQAPVTMLTDSVLGIQAANLLVKNLLAAYRALDVFNSNEALILYINGEITTAGTAVTTAGTAITTAELFYENNVANYNLWSNELELLNVQLVAAQDLVAYWKALLDAALAG